MNIKLQTTKKSLSAHSGIYLLHRMYDLLGIKNNPKFKFLLFCFYGGLTCLDDVNIFRNENAFSKTLKTFAPQTIHKYLAGFTNRKLEVLEDFLITLNFRIISIFYPDEKEFILDMDGTYHVQRGLKMEGVAWNYKDQWCLSSQNAYDQHGLSYAMRVRKGSAHSSVGSTELINKIFTQVPSKLKRFFRGDSAYFSVDNVNALFNKNVSFAIPVSSTITKSQLEKNNVTWHKCKSLKFFKSDECELAEGRYKLEGLNENVKDIRIVFLRVPIDQRQDQIDLFFDEEYRYYSIVTNISLNDKNSLELFKFYSKRANCENFIREQKYGFDFLHFPSRSLTKNQAYGLIGTFAYNFSRVISTLDKTGNHFIKQLRLKTYNLGCLVTKHARSVRFIMNKKDKEVLETIMNNINEMFSRYYQMQIAPG